MKRRRGLVAALVAVIGFAPVAVAVHAAGSKAKSIKSRKQKEGRAMNETSEKTARALRLPDPVYYDSADEAFAKVAATLAPPDVPARPIVAGMAGLGLDPVLALGAPGVVALDRGSDLPAVVLHRYSGARTWEAMFAPNFHVVVVDLRSGALKWVNPLLLDDPEFDPSRSGPPPSELTRRASLHGATRFHIPALFGETWPSPSYAVTAIYYDWLSNTVTVAGHPPAGLGPAPTPSPSTFLEPGPREPSPAPGLTLKLPAQRGAGGTLPVTGSVSAAADAIHVGRISGEGEHPGAAMVATLLLVTLDGDRPRTIELVAPIDLHGDVATGSFGFDLAARPELTGLAGDVQVYLTSGQTIVAAGSLAISPR